MLITSPLPQKHDWDWRNLLPQTRFNELFLDGMPGWDKNEHGIHGVRLPFSKGNGPSSHNIAVWWDDLAVGQFYYRDFTDSGLPFVDEGEVYASSFYFQFHSDAIRFLEWQATLPNNQQETK